MLLLFFVTVHFCCFSFFLVADAANPLPATAVVAPLTPLFETRHPPIVPDFFTMYPGMFVSPLNTPLNISNTFGPRWLSGRMDYHRGVDYNNVSTDGSDEPIFAIGDATIYSIQTVANATSAGAGNQVVLEHVLPATVTNSNFHGANLQRFWTYYFHMKSILPAVLQMGPGEPISKGQQLGVMGDTGVGINSVHLHLEVRLQGRCSLEFQVASGKALPQAGSTCYTSYDPHVHAYSFVGGERGGEKRIDEIVPLNSSYAYACRYTVTRGHLDLDTIASDLGAINFQLRQLSMPGQPNTTFFSTLEQLDDLLSLAPFMSLVPGDFSRFTPQCCAFYDVHFRTRPSWVEFVDIYGHGVKAATTMVSATTTTTTTTTTSGAATSSSSSTSSSTSSTATTTTSTTSVASTTTTVATTATTTTGTSSPIVTSTTMATSTITTTNSATTNPSFTTTTKPADTQNNNSNSSAAATGDDTAVIAGASAAAVVFLLLIAGCVFFFVVKKKRDEETASKHEHAVELRAPERGGGGAGDIVL